MGKKFGGLITYCRIFEVGWLMGCAKFSAWISISPLFLDLTGKIEGPEYVKFLLFVVCCIAVMWGMCLLAVKLKFLSM